MAVRVDGYTQEEAEAELTRWKSAVAALASSQSYTIGTRTLTRVDLTEAREMVAYFAGLVSGFEAGTASSGVRAIRVVPRDL